MRNDGQIAVERARGSRDLASPAEAEPLNWPARRRGPPSKAPENCQSGRVDLRRLFLGLQEQMVASLSTSREEVSHPGTKGDAAELQWLGMLNAYLPRRYRADKAFVVDYAGHMSEQIDVVLYDRHYSPFLFNQDGAKYVPAESVYGVLEAKQELSASNLKYAREKAGSVRRLWRTSARIPHAGGTFRPKTPPRILAGFLALDSKWSPAFGASLQRALAKGSAEERLDLGCVLRHGAFEIRYPRKARPQVKTAGGESALIFFLLRLLARLQECGTAVAVDFETYGRVL